MHNSREKHGFSSKKKINSDFKYYFCITDEKWQSIKNPSKKYFHISTRNLKTGEVKVPINAVRKNPLEAEEAAVGEEC